jgi:hypothetical protein
VSDFQTYEIVVKVAMRVSAYDKEHAVDVASELLTPIAGVMFVSENKLNNSMSDSILKQTKEASYNDGVVSALSELREVYGKELELTDIWGSYMKEENN